MSQDDRTAQGTLTPEERRGLLRALADRMLLKVSAMDDPEDLAGIEKTVRVTASIERIYYRCDRAEHHTPDPRKVEAERATHESAAIKARVALATDLEWGEMRRTQLGKWWDAAQDATEAPAAPVQTPAASPNTAPQALGDRDIGPVLDSLLDDLDALTEAAAAGKAIPPPSRSYPPAETAPFSNADEGSYAVAMATYNNLRRHQALKAGNASP